MDVRLVRTRLGSRGTRPPEHLPVDELLDCAVSMLRDGPALLDAK